MSTENPFEKCATFTDVETVLRETCEYLRGRPFEEPEQFRVYFGRNPSPSEVELLEDATGLPFRVRASSSEVMRSMEGHVDSIDMLRVSWSVLLCGDYPRARVLCRKLREWDGHGFAFLKVKGYQSSDVRIRCNTPADRSSLPWGCIPLLRQRIVLNDVNRKARYNASHPPYPRTDEDKEIQEAFWQAQAEYRLLQAREQAWSDACVAATEAKFPLCDLWTGEQRTGA